MADKILTRKFETSNIIDFYFSADRRSKLISAPTNFNHISHMGPGEGIQKQRLIDLSNLNTTEQPPSYPTQPRIPPKAAPPPPKAIGRTRPEISNPTPVVRPNFPPYNGAKRAAPPRPRDLPPSLPRGATGSAGDQGNSGDQRSLERGNTPSSLGSMSSLHDIIKVKCELVKYLLSPPVTNTNIFK